MSTTKATLLKTIRARCMDCCGYQPDEVKLCPAEDCPLWPFRLGKDPYKTPRQLSPAQRDVLSKMNARRGEKTRDTLRA